ncbi:TetR/AcrR family transcriptional regulator [Amycolatopsis sp. NPDC059657]|uniref:TetR/AcrR family transcriptional regulator n=1 Tax=Amycolatopsis sp. NPDC059657 TaxID=3346899 RepID=UPI00366DCF7C
MPKIVDPESRRTAVIEAVFRVVSRDGVEHASLRNVAEEAGLAIGSIRHYFTNHAEMMIFAMREIGERITQRILAHAELLLGEDRDRIDRAATTLKLLSELLPLDKERRDEAVVWLAFTTAARTRPDLQPYAREQFEGLRRLITRVLTEAGKGLDVDLEAVRLIALIDGLSMNAVLQPDLLDSDTMVAALRRHLESLRGS